MARTKIKRKLKDYGWFMLVLMAVLILSILSLFLKGAAAVSPKVRETIQPIMNTVDILSISFVPVALAVAGLLTLPVAQPLGIVLLVSAAVSLVFIVGYKLTQPDGGQVPIVPGQPNT